MPHPVSLRSALGRVFGCCERQNWGLSGCAPGEGEMVAAFGREGGYAGPASVIHLDSAQPDHPIIVPDAELLFTAQFHRVGPDLVLVGRDGRHHLIPGYFSSEHGPGLVAPNGASLPAHLVDLLAGSPTPGEYAQAQSSAAASDPIGRVEKVVGNVTVVRNGVAVALNVGDTVYKSDVIQTADHSSVGIAFPDGTALNLVANTRMALNEYSFDAASTSNSALFNLIQGGLSFVAGKVAHDGDMHIGTPVAVVGIRGTAGWLYEDQVPVGVTAQAGNVTLHFAAVFDEVTRTESTYTLYAIDANGNLLQDTTGNPVALATVSSTQSGQVTTLNGNGIGALPTVLQAPANITQQQFQQTVMPQVVNFAIQGIQQFQQQQPGTNPNANPNAPNNAPSGGTGSGGTPPTSTAPGEFNSEIPPLTQNGNAVAPTVANTSVSVPVVVTVATTTQVIPIAPPTPPPPTVDTWISPSGGNWTVPGDWSGSAPPGPQAPAEIGSGQSTVDSAVVVGNLTVDTGAAVTVVSNADPTVASSLTVAGTAEVAGTVMVNSTMTDPAVTFDDAVVVDSGGLIAAVADGSAATIVFGSGVTLAAAADPLPGGKVEASGSGASVTLNDGAIIEAGAEIEATGAGTVFITGAAGVDNSGMMIADNGGTLTLFNVQVTNGATGVIEAVDSGSLVSLSGSDIVGGTLVTGDPASSGSGTIEVGAGLEATFFDGSTSNGSVVVDAFVQVNDGAQLELLGTINNQGTVVIGVSSGAELLISGSVTLEGSGVVTLNGAILAGATGSDTLVDNSNAISGSGSIENLTLQNEGGSITAAGGTLSILASVVNDGTMTATNDAILSLGGAVSGTGSTFIDAGGTVVVGALDSQAITFTGIARLQINPAGELTGAIDNLAPGDVIDFTNNTSITSTSISGSTLTVNESSGGPLTFTIGGALAGNSFVVQSDDEGGTELVLAPVGAPVIAVPGAQTIGVGVAAAIGGISVSESDVATLSDTDSITGADTITVNASDSFGNVAATRTITVTATGAVNNVPSGPLTTVENTPLGIGGLSVSDRRQLI
jgi:FecR protein